MSNLINYPVTYRRNFFNDFSQNSGPLCGRKAKKVALAILPIMGLYRPFRKPLACTMSGVRVITHSSELVKHWKKQELGTSLFHLMQTSLAVASLRLYFINPVYSFVVSSMGDSLVNARNMIVHLQKGQSKEAWDACRGLILDLLFLSSICYGTLELTVVFFVLQSLNDFYQTYQAQEGLEGISHLILGIFHVREAAFQGKALCWKWQHAPDFKVELKRSGNFVYLDLPDEYLYSLYEFYKEKGITPPPYFKPGMVGAHISVISAHEISDQLLIKELRQKFSFQLVNADRIQKGTAQIYFLTGTCPELDKMRLSYGLAPKIEQDHDWHFTFAIGTAL